VAIEGAALGTRFVLIAPIDARDASEELGERGAVDPQGRPGFGGAHGKPEERAVKALVPHHELQALRIQAHALCA
jgi:hypothetical protein